MEMKKVGKYLDFNVGNAKPFLKKSFKFSNQ